MGREVLEGPTVEATRRNKLKARKIFAANKEIYASFLERTRTSLNAESTQAWKETVQNGYTPKIPLQILLAASLACDKHCPMCYTGQNEYRLNVQQPVARAGGMFMSQAVFEPLFKEIDAWNHTDNPDKMYSFKLSPGGEPLLNRDLPRILETIRKSDFDYDIFVMTAVPRLWSMDMWQDLCEQLVSLKVNTISISAEGWDKKSYEAMRVNGNFEDFVAKMKMLREVRDKLSRNGSPGIRWQTIITPYLGDRTRLQKAVDAFGRYADVISINGEVDYIDEDDIRKIVRIPDFSCYEPRARMMVYPGLTSQGEVGLVVAQCVNDEKIRNPVGIFPDESVYQIWNGPKMEKIRQEQASKRAWADLPRTCGVCYLPRKIEPIEKIDLRVPAARLVLEPFRYVGRRKETILKKTAKKL